MTATVRVPSGFGHGFQGFGEALEHPQGEGAPFALVQQPVVVLPVVEDPLADGRWGLEYLVDEGPAGAAVAVGEGMDDLELQVGVDRLGQLVLVRVLDVCVELFHQLGHPAVVGGQVVAHLDVHGAEHARLGVVMAPHDGAVGFQHGLDAGFAADDAGEGCGVQVDGVAVGDVFDG